MIKAKEFWKFLCEGMDYRIFSGVPCLGFATLYDCMSSKFMHYIPAVDEHSAFGISLGAAVAGVRTGVLVDCNYLDLTEDWMKFCFEHKKHVVILTNGEPKNNVSKLVFDGDYTKLEKYLSTKRKGEKPAIIVLEGVSK